MKKEIIEKFASLITAAFGFVAALAWNSAIQAIFKKIFGTSENISAMISYAIIVTVFAVLATIWIARAEAKIK